MYVFENVDPEIVTEIAVLEGFRHARAADVRTWPAWCYLTGARATDALDMRARAARVAPSDRNVEQVSVFLWVRQSARNEI